MINLMRKDWKLLVKTPTLLVFLFDAVLFEVLLWVDSISIRYIAPVFVIQFAMLVASYEERFNSHKFVGSLPVSRWQIVSAKYVAGLAYVIVGYAMALVLASTTSFIKSGVPSPLSHYDLFETMSGALLMLAVFVPIFYQFDKWFLSFSAAVLMEVLFFQFIPEIWSWAGSGLILAGCLLLYGVSYYVSLRVFQKKDF